MMRVAPFASVKSVSAHIELQTVGGCGLWSGMSWSSAWIGCAISPGRIEIDDSDEIRQPGSSTPSTIGSTLRVHGTRSKTAEREQVVDAERVVALERVRRRLDLEELLEAQQVATSASTRSGSIAFSTIV